ncbi:MAG: EAL domain-containing protein [Candidatus Accumulibacter sp.]|jgi:diguanylate cyclase (GGDEF)-like protein/PAS domain S-box-containing protein|nr:EAL domain-containing protein [Accumulibacter sp.]
MSFATDVARSAGSGKSLLRNTLFLVSGMALLVFVFFILVALLITQRHAEWQSRKHLDELIESVSVMAGTVCLARDTARAGELADAIIEHSDVRRVTITAHGQTLATAALQDDQPEEARAGDGTNIVRTLYSPIDPEKEIGELTLEPNWREIRENATDEARCIAAMLFLLAGALVGTIAVVVSRAVVRPVKDVSDQLHALDAGSDEMLIPPRRHESDEIGRLVEDVNDMASRLRISLDQQHELHLQRVLSEKFRLPAAMFENSQNGILITDHNNRIIRTNRAFTQITGYTEEEALGKDPGFMASGRHDRVFYEKMWNELLGFGRWMGELWNRCKDGQIRPEWFSISVVRGNDGEIVNYAAIFSDISEHKIAEERLDFIAHHDPLTQLANLTLTRERFALALTSTTWSDRGIAMLCIDLDGFKYVNDAFSHQIGDQLLLSVAERLKDLVRGTDTISREGGDEFVILLPGLKNIDVVHRICTDILGRLALPFDIAEQTIGISASIGVACHPQHGSDFDTLLKKADVAMYAAKNSGKNSYRVFVEEMNVDMLDKLKLRAHLSNAFTNDEFHVVFQPQLDLATDRIIGAEVLCRWTHPKLGAISPIRFIALAEESGLINRLGEWVLRQACIQGKRWFDSGIPPFVIAVNVSPKQFNHSDLVDTIKRILDEFGFPAQYLELELTESGLLDDIERSVGIINRLKVLGVRLSIDDFGTGYSGLSYLKQFKVEKLKIDQSFVHDIDAPGGNLGIVRAIIQMGRTLRMDVIAEGVETERQKDILTKLECHEIQGYLVSKPLSPSEFEEFVIRHWNTLHTLSGTASANWSERLIF